MFPQTPTVLSEEAEKICWHVIKYFKEESERRTSIEEIDLEYLRTLKGMENASNASADSSKSSELSKIELMLYKTNKKYQNVMKSLSDMWLRAAAATGVSRKRLRNIKKSALKKGALKKEAKAIVVRKRGFIDIKELVEKMLEEKGNRITTGEILKRVQEELDYPCKQPALRTILLKKLGYRFERVPGGFELRSPYKKDTELSEVPEKKRKLDDDASGPDDDKNEVVETSEDVKVQGETDSEIETDSMCKTEYDIDIKEEFIG